MKEATDEKGLKVGESFPMRDNLYYVSSIESFIRDLPRSSQEVLAKVLIRTHKVAQATLPL